MVNHLVVSDAHDAPGVPQDRFTWLGRYCVKTQPEVVIFNGDFADMPSLCSYEFGKKSHEGKRYKEDIAHANKALDKFMAPLIERNSQLKRNGKKMYRPRLVFTEGNHEYRIAKAMQHFPYYDGIMSLDDFNFKKFGFEVYPFLEPVVIDGVTYVHYLKVKGAAERAVSGKHHAASLIDKHKASITVGHSHNLDLYREVNGVGQGMIGLVAGCFFDNWKSYAGTDQLNWWSGVVLCKNVKDGMYDPNFISLKELGEEFS